MICRFILVAASAMAAGVAAAQQNYSVDELAVVRDFEAVTFDPSSVRELGGLTRFEVTIRYNDPERRPPGAPAKRQVRYAVRCADAQAVISGVTLIDENGRMLKSIIVPPGGADFAMPAADSREVQWIKRACGK